VSSNLAVREKYRTMESRENPTHAAYNRDNKTKRGKNRGNSEDWASISRGTVTVHDAVMLQYRMSTVACVHNAEEVTVGVLKDYEIFTRFIGLRMPRGSYFEQRFNFPRLIVGIEVKV
jgi:hypothetical protein